MRMFIAHIRDEQLFTVLVTEGPGGMKTFERDWKQCAISLGTHKDMDRIEKKMAELGWVIRKTQIAEVEV